MTVLNCGKDRYDEPSKRVLRALTLKIPGIILFKNGAHFKEQQLKKPRPTILFEMLCFCIIKVYVFSVQYLKNQKRNQNSQTPLFTTLHYNMLKSKMTEKISFLGVKPQY